MESARWDETWHRLREWTNGQTRSERLAAQILINEGFKGLDPSHPLGGPDKGKDAICYLGEDKWVMAVYFARGEKKIFEIKKKLQNDISVALKHQPCGLVFVTNQELELKERQEFEKIAASSRQVCVYCKIEEERRRQKNVSEKSERNSRG